MIYHPISENVGDRVTFNLPLVRARTISVLPYGSRSVVEIDATREDLKMTELARPHRVLGAKNVNEGRAVLLYAVPDVQSALSMVAMALSIASGVARPVPGFGLGSDGATSSSPLVRGTGVRSTSGSGLDDISVTWSAVRIESSAVDTR